MWTEDTLESITWLGLKWREDSQVIKRLKWKVQGVHRELSGHREPGSVSQETRIKKKKKKVNKSKNDLPPGPNFGKFCVLRDIIPKRFTGHLFGPLSSMPSFVRT